MVVLLSALAVAGRGQTVREVVDSVQSGVKSGNVKTMIASVKDAFAVKAANAEMMIGTWEYSEPAVYVTSNNLMYKTVGSVACDKLESFLGHYIKKGNITSRNTYITFNANGTFVRSLAGRKAKGVWMMSGDKLLLAIKNVQTASLTTHVEGDRVMILTEAAKIINTMRALGTLDDTNTMKTIEKLSKTLKGVEGGFLLNKKK